MKLSELVNELTAELIRDGDANIALVRSAASDPGKVFFDRKGDQIAVMFRESDEVLAQRAEAEFRRLAQEELYRNRLVNYPVHTGMPLTMGVVNPNISTVGGGSISAASPVTDKHTLKALYESMLGKKGF